VSSGSVPHLAQRARIKTVAPSLGCTILSTNDAHTSRAAYQTWGQLSSSGLLLLPSSLRRLAFVQMSKQGSLSALSVSRGGGGNPKLNCNKQQRKLCCQVVCFRSDFGCILHKSGHVQIAGPSFCLAWHSSTLWMSGTILPGSYSLQNLAPCINQRPYDLWRKSENRKCISIRNFLSGKRPFEDHSVKPTVAIQKA